jgi:hypothetical protein
MSTNVLLHVNAMRATEEARAAFYQLLKENLWIRMHPVYTNWCCRFSAEVDDVPTEVKSEIHMLAVQAGVVSLHAVVQCGNSPAFWFDCNGVTRADAPRA